MGNKFRFTFEGEYRILYHRNFIELITIAGRSSVQNMSSSNCKLLSVGCSHSEFPILLHPIFVSCHSQCLALSSIFMCACPDLVCTICTSLAISNTPELSTWNVWFLCHGTNFVQKMTRHYFFSVSVLVPVRTMETHWNSLFSLKSAPNDSK